MHARIDQNISVLAAICGNVTRVKGRMVILTCTLHSALTLNVRDDQLHLISTLLFCARDCRVVKANMRVFRGYLLCIRDWDYPQDMVSMIPTCHGNSKSLLNFPEVFGYKMGKSPFERTSE